MVFDDAWAIEYLDIAFEDINQDWVEREVTSDTYLDEYIGLIQPDLQSMRLCRRSSDYHGQTTISEIERQNHVAGCDNRFPILI